MVEQISKATQRNWDKLGVDKLDGKLVSRANKQLSIKTITPVEYFDNKANIKPVEELVSRLIASAQDIDVLIYSLGVSILKQRGILNKSGQTDNAHLAEFLALLNYKLLNVTDLFSVPKDETDILGLIYQCLLTEGVKNKQGSYYTPKDVVRDMVGDIKLTGQQRVLDPCCGSLVYLLNIPNIKPEQIYGMDIDPTAVMIAKFNYFLKFPKAGQPNIVYGDYLGNSTAFANQKYDYVVTNPPWGASTSNSQRYPVIKSGETFSCFLVEASNALKKNGQLRFLLPESILNVKTHRDIREYILNETNLKSIKVYSKLFSGVTTKYVSMSIDKSGDSNEVEIDVVDRSWGVEKSVYRSSINKIFRLSDSVDESIIEKVLVKKKYDLGNSIWALGIVTGNNKEKLLSHQDTGLEKIYTGKEIAPYILKEPRRYIKYDRSKLQQVAKDEIYRTAPKLVYKFISKKLVFAVDESSSLFLNSANILVPQIPNMSTKTVAAFLNSELYQYLYIKLFREIKILKGNLIQLPFPEIDDKTDKQISRLVDKMLRSSTDTNDKLQDLIFKLYSISSTEITNIRKELHGRVN